jgi:hypothetical protein
MTKATFLSSDAEMFSKFNAFVQAVVLPIFLAVNAIVAVNQYYVFEKIGEQGAKIDSLKEGQVDLKTAVTNSVNGVLESNNRIEDKIGNNLNDLQVRLAELNSRLDASQRDLRKILISTNVVSAADVFDAFVQGNDVWVVPSQALRVRLEKKGMQIERISEKAEVYGFKLMKIDAVGGN